MDTHTIESVDDRLVNFTRLVLALSALIIIYVDPSEPDRLVKITYTTLALYTVFSASVYFLLRKNDSVFDGLLGWIRNNAQTPARAAEGCEQIVKPALRARPDHRIDHDKAA